MTLLDTIAALHASEINSGLQTSSGAGVTVWLGPDARDDRIVAQKEFAISDLREAASWLDQQARKLYPDSDYAKS